VPIGRAAQNPGAARNIDIRLTRRQRGWRARRSSSRGMSNRARRGSITSANSSMGRARRAAPPNSSELDRTKDALPVPGQRGMRPGIGSPSLSVITRSDARSILPHLPSCPLSRRSTTGPRRRSARPTMRPSPSRPCAPGPYVPDVMTHRAQNQSSSRGPYLQQSRMPRPIAGCTPANSAISAAHSDV